MLKVSAQTCAFRIYHAHKIVRERQIDKHGHTDIEKEMERECVCVCVCWGGGGGYRGK